MKRWDSIIERISGRENVIMAEIGVERGKMAEVMLAQPNIKTYYCIDTWAYDPAYAKTAKHKDTGPQYHAKNFKRFLSIAAKWPQKMKIIQTDTFLASEIFMNNSLDIAFIDANHSFDFVCRDISVWVEKVKDGGWICGHDYASKRFPGVKKAVDLFFPNEIKTGAQETWFYQIKRS